MLGMGRRDGSTEVKPSVKNVLAPAAVRPVPAPSNVQTGMPLRPPAPPATPTVAGRNDAPLPPATPSASTASKENTSGGVPVLESVASSAPTVADTPGSKLFVGANIKLKGVEISDCDVLVVEGHVEATVFSKGLQIAKPGTVIGTVAIDVAEIFGTFSGELTVRTRLVVHGTGRVSGKIRYGKLIVEEGGELTGDVRQLDGSEDQPQLVLASGDSHPSQGL